MKSFLFALTLYLFQVFAVDFENECGRTFNEINAEESKMIYGGYNAEINEYPWIASIHVDGKRICTGSIISKRHILAAAHCYMYPILSGFSKEDYFTVHVGSKYPIEGKVYNVENIYTMDKEITKLIPNEIAIFEVSFTEKFLKRF